MSREEVRHKRREEEVMSQDGTTIDEVRRKEKHQRPMALLFAYKMKAADAVIS